MTAARVSPGSGTDADHGRDPAPIAGTASAAAAYRSAHRAGELCIDFCDLYKGAT